MTSLADILLAFDEALAQHVPQLHAELAPAASENEIEAAGTRLGFRLPEDLQTWWRWHNGSVTNNSVVPSWKLMSIGAALGSRAINLEVAAEVADPKNKPPFDDAEWMWPANFLPIFASGGPDFLAANCQPGRSSSIHLKQHGPDPKDHLQIVAASLKSLVSGWIEMYENGLYRWDEEHSRVVYNTYGPDPYTYSSV